MDLSMRIVIKVMIFLWLNMPHVFPMMKHKIIQDLAGLFLMDTHSFVRGCKQQQQPNIHAYIPAGSSCGKEGRAHKHPLLGNTETQWLVPTTPGMFFAPFFS